jgi:hypothetical protein
MGMQAPDLGQDTLCGRIYYKAGIKVCVGSRASRVYSLELRMGQLDLLMRHVKTLQVPTDYKFIKEPLRERGFTTIYSGVKSDERTLD